MDKNPMACDLETGICGVPGNDDMEVIDLNHSNKNIDLYYVTDPICSHCWALEPTLRRFISQYGHYFNFHTVMGGLLEKWEDFGDAANGISKPSDVAEHWKEVGVHSRMPIDGSLWVDNPIQSSFPPSRVYKVLQQRDKSLANAFLRRARESVFAFNLNIGDQAVLIDIVNKLGLDGASIVEEAQKETGRNLLKEDFRLAASLGVRGFPTIIMVNQENKGVKIVGARQLEYYIDGLKQALDQENIQPKVQPKLSDLLKEEKVLFSKEIEVMYDIDQAELSSFVKKELSSESYIQKEILGESYFLQAD
ncbi:DsbA family protein (plasmid) [Niallia circulans]|uniref:DsbA family protein n=1 Tax=Niallia circulans TaxID=1397 RepID=A0A553SQD5_NIACI|nr:DsbA family protein [Niallia circulans]TRZ39209.1 DsbA family protein [Niallia circulans]